MALYFEEPETEAIIWRLDLPDWGRPKDKEFEVDPFSLLLCEQIIAPDLVLLCLEV